MTKRVPLTKEFEREAVRLAETSGRTQKEIAADLGIGLSTLTRWISR
ncbi:MULTISPECIES: helix-turn-helix domain-containing protein, partial [Brucella]